MTRRHLYLIGGLIVLAGAAYWWMKKTNRQMPFNMWGQNSNPAGANNGVIAKPGAPDSINENPDASPYQIDRSDLDAFASLN